MSFTVVPSGGPMWNQPLSDMRVKALLAVDEGDNLPADLIAYIVALENRYHDLRDHQNREFLRSSWEARQRKEGAE